jgi:hypothetical protein
MECTNGKLECGKDAALWIGDTKICTLNYPMTFNKDKSININDDIAQANAQELVRRWNAFEDGGLVVKLLAACDEGLHECNRVKMHCTCEHKDIAGLLRRIERIEAAIASARG